MIALLLAIAACGTSRPTEIDPADRAMVVATIDAWNARQDLGQVDRSVVVLIRDERHLGEYCGGAAGCATFVYPDPMARGIPVVNVAYGLNAVQRRAVIVHEMLHHLFVIAEHGHDDRDHRDARVWCDYSRGGCAPGSVEFAANAALREGG